MKPHLNEALTILISILPLRTREYVDTTKIPDVFSASRKNLTQTLQQELGKKSLSSDAIELFLDMVETILDGESTLDQGRLQNGDWQFVSYEAQLMGLSKLAALADPRARSVDQSFWAASQLKTAGGQNLAYKRLKQAEDERWNSIKKEDPDGEIQAIRRSHVVWAFIKLDGKFLFHQKEAGDVVSDLGSFVLVGGKMREGDFPTTPLSDCIHLLNNRALENSHVDNWKKAMAREINEEVAEHLEGDNGLIFNQDYTLSEITPSIESYVDHRGVGVVWSTVRYHFKLFQVHLELPGYLKLIDNCAKNTRLVWASIGQIKASKINRGKLDIDALHSHFPGGFSALAEKLDMMENSSSMPYKQPKNDEGDKENTGEASSSEKPLKPLFGIINPPRKKELKRKKESKSGIIIPARKGQSLEVATTSSGSDVANMEKISQTECDLLLGLAVHGRGWNLEKVPCGVELHCEGWIDATDNEALCQGLLNLASKNNDYFDVYDSRYFRLSVKPTMVWFHPSFFTMFFHPTKSKLNLTVVRSRINTAFGSLITDENSYSIKPTYVGMVRRMANGQELPIDEVESMERTIRDNNLSGSVGLWRIMRSENKISIPTCEWKETCE